MDEGTPVRKDSIITIDDLIMHYECDKYAAQSIRSVVYIRVAISVWLRFSLKIPAQSV